jgi:hypothetical protein
MRCIESGSRRRELLPRAVREQGLCELRQFGRHEYKLGRQRTEQLGEGVAVSSPNVG